MAYLHFSYEHVLRFISEKDINSYDPLVRHYHDLIHSRHGIGNDFLGWLDVPADEVELTRMKTVAERVKKDSDVLLVIGVGGSYLGAHAAIEMLGDTFGYLGRKKADIPEIIFTGHHISATYNKELLRALKDVDVSINVISKSGTTTEPGIAFRIFRAFLEEKYGEEEAARRIYVTTDKSEGALKTLADEKGYETFVIPDDIGGRYSVLTPVGLLPMAVSGIDIDAAIAGARQAAEDLATPTVQHNIAYQYAVIRHLLYEKNFTTEILSNYDPKLRYFSDWWIQLFGESEGKDGKGIFPAVANFPTDLHSLGQYIQDGRRQLFQTILRVDEEAETVVVERDEANLDGLNYLVGKSLNEINRVASDAALKAHVDGGVPNMVVDLPRLDAYTFGYIVYFFKKACAMSGYLLEVNPFDQPGVEAYKTNMFEMLGKPGYVSKSKLR